MDGHHLFEPEDDRTWHKPWFHSTDKRLASEEKFERFMEMQCTQIRELLSDYGPVAYLWLDQHPAKLGFKLAGGRKGSWKRSERSEATEQTAILIMASNGAGSRLKPELQLVLSVLCSLFAQKMQAV